MSKNCCSVMKQSEKKQYIMSSIESIKDTLNCEVDMDAISDMIDSICQASKIINAEAKKG